MIEVSNIRIGNTITASESNKTYFTSALVDVFSYRHNMFGFRVNKKLEKDVPILCEWYLNHSMCERWFRVDNLEEFPPGINYKINKEVYNIKSKEKLQESISKYESIKSKPL